MQVLTAITVWCDHNGPEAFLGLLPAVRLENMRAHELHSMSQHAMVLEHPPALEQVHAALAAAYSPDKGQHNPKQAPRCSSSSHSCTLWKPPNLTCGLRYLVVLKFNCIKSRHADVSGELNFQVMKSCTDQTWCAKLGDLNVFTFPWKAL